jgi:myo-inositol-1(or 4)-monophosphatase
MMAGDEASADLALIRDAAREAGTIAMRHFRNDPDVWMKNGTSPVSAADIAVDTFLRETLSLARPDYGWLSEETVDNPARLGRRRTFVVDPIDGTRAFIAGRDTWCVSIAVVEAGSPLAGVLECPALGEFYEAAEGGPALLNGAELRIAAASSSVAGSPIAGPKVAGPDAMLKRAPSWIRGGPHIPYIPSLAYRIAMVAGGALDATFVKPNAHDWDLAAADLILRRAGGRLVERDGAAPAYAGADPRHGALAAGCGALLDAMARVIAGLDDGGGTTSSRDGFKS